MQNTHKKQSTFGHQAIGLGWFLFWCFLIAWWLSRKISNFGKKQRLMTAKCTGRKYTNNQSVPPDADKQVYYYFYLNLWTGITCWAVSPSDRLIIVFSRCLDADQHSYLVPQPDMPPNICGKQMCKQPTCGDTSPQKQLVGGCTININTQVEHYFFFSLLHGSPKNTALENSTIKKQWFPITKCTSQEK